MTALISNTLKKYESDMEFRRLFEKQETLCLPHFYELCSAADKKWDVGSEEEFKSAAKELTLRSIESLHGDVKHFCDMFDYRNNGEKCRLGKFKRFAGAGGFIPHIL